MSDIDAQHGRIQSQYAGYRSIVEVKNQIKDTEQSIEVPRHVQPVPITKETEQRKASYKVIDLKVIQTALFTILLALIMLVVLPNSIATGVVFLILCVGVSVGIYLSTR